MKQFWLAALLTLTTGTTLAHSALETTTPTQEAVVAELPPALLLNFKSDIRLTRLTLRHAEDAPTPLDLSNHDGFIDAYTFPLDAINSNSGDYTVDWRGLGADGHALKGTFSFTVE